MTTPRDGLVVGLLAVASGVGVLGGSVVRCCVLGRLLSGWVWRWVWCLVVGLGVGVFLKACFLVWARIAMKATAKCDQRCELHDSVNHLKVKRRLFCSGFS